jgi:hypothetical protein
MDLMKRWLKHGFRQCSGSVRGISRPALRGAADLAGMISRLEALGFSIVGLYPVNRTRLMQVIEFDCLMINSRFATQVH